MEDVLQLFAGFLVCHLRLLRLPLSDLLHLGLRDHADFNRKVWAHIELVEGQDGVAVVQDHSVKPIALHIFIVEDLGGADLSPVREAIRLHVFVLSRVAKLDLSVDAERLTNNDFKDRVVFGHDDELALKVHQVHDDFVGEMELLTLHAVDVLPLDMVVHQVHVWAGFPITKKIN